MRNQFRIRHSQRHFYRFSGGLVPATPIQVVELRSQDASGVRASHAPVVSALGKGSVFNRGLKSAHHFMLEVVMSGGVRYVRRHGTLYRVDRLTAA